MDFYFYPSAAETADLILQRVYERKGKISHFAWESGGCRFAIDGCRAEEIVFDKVCSVSYGSKISNFTVSFPVASESPECGDFSLSARDFLEKLKEFLVETGACVQQEKCSDRKVAAKFFVSHHNLRDSLFACVRCACRSLWCEEQVEILGGANGVFVSVGFAMGAAESLSVLPFLASYSSLFACEDISSLYLQYPEKTVLHHRGSGMPSSRNGNVGNVRFLSDAMWSME